jgi:HEAT repeat protein
VTQVQSPLVLSPSDRERIAEVDKLAHEQRETSVPSLIALLTSRSWAVRRAVVAALARLGDPAVRALSGVLLRQRDDEDRLSAAVDALSASRGDAVPSMLELLGAADNAVVCDAAQVLGRRRSREAVEALGKLTGQKDDNVAVASIEALGRIGDGAGIEALVQVLRGKNFFRIFPAIDVLGRSGDPRALEPLLALLENPRYALEAARALGRTGEVAAVAPLAALLRKSNDALTRVVAISLCAIHARTLDRFGTSASVEGALRSGEDPLPIIQRLSQSVPGASPEEQAALCNVLVWTRDDSAAATLISLLDVTPGAASAALRALGRESDPQLVAALREGDSARRALLLPLVSNRTRVAGDVEPCLSDPDPAVRVLACNALARIGDPSVVPRLFQLFSESDPMVGQAAVSAIQSLGSKTTETMALQAARAPDARLRRAALRIVAYFGYPAGLDLLVEAVQSNDDRLRDASIHGLALMDDPRALQTLLQTAQNPNPRARSAAMRALGQSEAGKETLEALRGGLSDGDAWVRYYACQSLGKLADKGAIAKMLSLVRDPAGQVRVAAVEALARLDAPEALSSLRLAAASDDPDVQRAALLGLGARQLPEVLPALLQAALNADPSTRLIAISAIASYSAPEAINALAAASGDPEASVRDAAIGFLASRTGPAATNALIASLGNPLTRDRAVEGLASPVAGRIAGVAQALETAGHELATSLVAALARMKRADALAAIIDALSLGNTDVRRASAAALAALRSPQAKAALERAVDEDTDGEVRRIGLAGLRP